MLSLAVGNLSLAGLQYTGGNPAIVYNWQKLSLVLHFSVVLVCRSVANLSFLTPPPPQDGVSLTTAP